MKIDYFEQLPCEIKKDISAFLQSNTDFRNALLISKSWYSALGTEVTRRKTIVSPTKFSLVPPHFIFEYNNQQGVIFTAISNEDLVKIREIAWRDAHMSDEYKKYPNLLSLLEANSINIETRGGYGWTFGLRVDTKKIKNELTIDQLRSKNAEIIKQFIAPSNACVTENCSAFYWRSDFVNRMSDFTSTVMYSPFKVDNTKLMKILTVFRFQGFLDQKMKNYIIQHNASMLKIPYKTVSGSLANKMRADIKNICLTLNEKSIKTFLRGIKSLFDSTAFKHSEFIARLAKIGNDEELDAVDILFAVESIANKTTKDDDLHSKLNTFMTTFKKLIDDDKSVLTNQL